MNMAKPSLYLHHLIPVSQSPTGASEEGLIFEIMGLDKSHASFELSDRFVNYVLKNVICGNCLGRIGNPTHLTLCEKPRKPESNLSDRYHRFCYVPTFNGEEFRRLWAQEKRRFRSFVRTAKLSKVPLPPEGILNQLKGKQESRCYYCFNEFQTNSSSLQPHLDHFVAVANGGTNSIFNLVYACGRCNREKFRENGEQFIKTLFIPVFDRLVMTEGLLNEHYRAMPELDSPEHGAWAFEGMKLLEQKQRVERESERMPVRLFPSDVRRKILEMRKSVGEWKEQLRPENLSNVEDSYKKHCDKMPDIQSPEFTKWLDEHSKLLSLLEFIRGEVR